MNKERFGKALRKLRNGKRRREVADRIGISSSSLYAYENGLRVPRDAVKEKLAKYYGVTVGDIFFN